MSTPRVIELHEERARVEKAPRVERVFWLHRTPQERKEVVDVELQREQLHIERVPMGCLVEAAPAVRYDEGMIVIPLVEEVLTCSGKALMLREEVRVTRRTSTQRVHGEVSLRREHVDVERVEVGQARGDGAQASGSERAREGASE